MPLSRYRAVLITGAGLVIVVFIIRACGDISERPRDVSMLARGDDEPRQLREMPVLEATPASHAPSRDGTNARGDTEHVPMDPLAAYLRASRYPPTSRPLTAAMDDLIHPNKRYETERPAADDPAVRFVLSADKTRVVGDEVLNAYLQVLRDGEPIAVDILRATASVDGARVATLDFRGENGLYTSSVAPETFFDERTAVISYAVKFAYAPDLVEKASFDVMYTPEATIPARFTGWFRDYIDGGSLIIEAGIDVDVAGRYLIDCNLYDAEGTPVAWARFTDALAEGEQVVPLKFFGKVIVDSGARPPFHIGELRGKRHVPRRTPDKDAMPSFAGEYITRDYALTEFSSADWDSPFKRKKIRFLQSEIARGTPLSRPLEPLDR